jgi:hypothetical protein
MDHNPKLLDQVRNTIPLKHYSIRNQQAYVDWIKRFILFHHQRHLATMDAPEAGTFLTHLAMERHVAASTQRRALSAIVFRSREILRQDLGWLEDTEQAKKPARLPMELSYCVRESSIRI